MSEYMEAEFLSRISRRQRAFLTLTALRLDRRGQWYRYHHLFRDMLLAELERLEPGLIPVLRRRAAGWCLRNGLTEEALEYSIALRTPTISLAWQRNSRCRPTGKAGS